MAIDIALAETRDEIAATWQVMRQLRPHLDADGYVATVLRLRAQRNFRLARMSVDGEVVAVAGGYGSASGCTAGAISRSRTS